MHARKMRIFGQDKTILMNDCKRVGVKQLGMLDVMKHHAPNLEHLALTRREFLGRCGMGMGSLAFASLFGGTLARASEASPNPLLPKEPHFSAKAKHVIHIF